MKKICLIVFICFGAILSLKADIETSLLYNKLWVYTYLEPDDSGLVYTARVKGPESDFDNGFMELMNSFTLEFYDDHSFVWDTHPSCGTNIGAVSGKGKWSYDAKKDVFILDYLGVDTEGYGKKGKEKYKVLILSNERFELQRLDTDKP